MPSLATQPADQAVTEGDSARFTVLAVGSAPLRYQWAVSSGGAVFTSIDGANSETYVISAPGLAASESRYRVVVSNDAGSVTSSAASLQVSALVVAPSVSVQPTDQAVTAPANATFHVTAAGTSLAYQWQVSADAGATFVAVTGSGSSPSLTVAATTAALSGQRYRVVVSNALSTITSSAALLSVLPAPVAPSFTSQPVAQTVVVGQGGSFSATASGTPAPAVRWQMGGVDLIEGRQNSGPCAGATASGTASNVLTLTVLPLACSGSAVAAVASNGVGPNVSSVVAVLTVIAAPAAPNIFLQPANAAVVTPDAATFTAGADGVPTPAVQWQQSLDGGASWANVNGAVDTSFTTPATQLADSGKQFRAVFSNLSGTATSRSAALTATPPAPLISLLLGDLGGRGNFDGQGTAARFNSPSAIAHDSAGILYVADAGGNLIRRVTPAGMVSTIAGSGQFDYADGQGRNAAFFGPTGIAVGPSGVLYVADTQNSVIRRVATDGTVTTLAGVGGDSGNVDGTGSSARFDHPKGIAVDAAGTLYVADTGNRSVRKIAQDGAVSTLAGGFGKFLYPTGIAVAAGGVVYVPDAELREILVVTALGDVSTLTATVTDSGGQVVPAQFNQPWGVALDDAGALYVVDAKDDTVRKIVTSTGVTTTIAGTPRTRGNADGVGGAALFYQPMGISVDAGGTVWVADTRNHTVRAIAGNGAVTTVAGLTENAGAVDGVGAVARFDPITALAVDSTGSVFIADRYNFTIRRVSLNGAVTTFAGSPGRNGIGDPPELGVGTAARFVFGTPNAIAVDLSGNLYVDSIASVLKVTPAAVVSEFAGWSEDFGTADGTGRAARFYSPQAFATDATGAVYVGDAAAIRKITPDGAVTTLAGVGDDPGGSLDGTASAARFQYVGGLVVESSGDVFAVDGNLIRKVTPAGVVTTVAGSTSAGPSADGTGSAARFTNLTGAIASDRMGNLYVSDDCTIRQVTTAGVVKTVLGVAGDCGIRLGANGRIYNSIAMAVLGPKRLLVASHDALLIADLP